MKLDLRQQHTGDFTFPSCHYHGLTVAFDLDVIGRSLAEEVRDFPVTPEGIVSRFSLGTSPLCAARCGRGGAHLRRIVPGAGKDLHPVLQSEDPGAAAVSRYHDHPGHCWRAPVFLPDAGGEGQSDPAVLGRAHFGALHAGGALSPLRHPHDGDEDLLPVGLWHIHRQLAGRLSDERGGGIAAPGAGAEHCGDRRPGRI